MRSLALVALAVLLATAAPAALAQDAPRATLAAQATPAQVDVSNGSAATRVLVTLTLHDFSCASDQDYRVPLSADAQGGASVVLDAASLVFTVPAGSFAFDDYQAQQWVGVNVSGAGDINITASFHSDGGANCIVPGGFPDANATATIHASAGGPVAEPTPSPTPAPVTNDTSANETSTNGTGANETAPPPSGPSAQPTPAENNSTGAVDNLPPGGGYVGDYQAPKESKSAVPAPGIMLGLLVVGAAAIALGRRAR